MLRRVLLSMSRSGRVRHLVETAPVSRSVVARFVAGTSAEEAVAATRRLVDKRPAGLAGPPRRGHPRRCSRPTDTRDAYLRLLKLLADGGLTVRRRGVGQALRRRPGAAGRRREARAGERARDLRGGPRGRHHGDPRHGGPHHHRLDARASCASCAQDFPETGAVLQAYLHRTEADCRDLAYAGLAGAAVQGRLQGAGRRSPSRASDDVDRAYVRCAEGADGRRRATRWWRPTTRGWSPSPRTSRAATAAPRTATSSRCSTASARTSRSGWPRSGERMRVYVPYGDEWYGYLVRRMAERPANLAFFLRSVATKG